MENQAQPSTQMDTEIRLVLTLGEVNAILQAMHKAPYEIAKPMIDRVTEEARKYLDNVATARNPAANELPVQQNINPFQS